MAVLTAPTHAPAHLKRHRYERFTGHASGGGRMPPTGTWCADEPSPRQAVIAPDEVVAVVSHVSVLHGPITTERARGAMLRRGERVLVVLADERWVGVVQRLTPLGALVYEDIAATGRS